MCSDSTEFRDDDLRQAICRAMPKTAAPAELRTRIEMAMAEGAPLPLPARNHLLRGHRAAVAACILGLFGGYLLYQFTSQPAETPMTLASSGMLPQSVAFSLAQQHMDMLAQETTQTPASETDFQNARQSLQTRLRLNMPAAELRTHGWKFKGASACRLNGTDAAHFRFSHAKETLSLFVLPRSAVTSGKGGYYAAEAVTFRGKAPVLCKVEGETVLCLMGNVADHQAMTVQQLRPLLDVISLR